MNIEKSGFILKSRYFYTLLCMIYKEIMNSDKRIQFPKLLSTSSACLHLQ